MKEEDSEILRIGKEVKGVMETYMKKMWGKKEEVKGMRIKGNKMEEEGREIMNKEIVVAEVRRAIKKLKKGKAPGGDMIPNEVWMALDDLGVKELTKMLADCVRERSFPRSWKVTQIESGYTRRGNTPT